MTDVDFRKPAGYKNINHSQVTPINTTVEKKPIQNEKAPKYVDPDNLTVDELLWLSYRK